MKRFAIAITIAFAAFAQAQTDVSIGGDLGFVTAAGAFAGSVGVNVGVDEIPGAPGLGIRADFTKLLADPGMLFGVNLMSSPGVDGGFYYGGGPRLLVDPVNDITLFALGALTAYEWRVIDEVGVYVEVRTDLVLPFVPLFGLSFGVRVHP